MTGPVYAAIRQSLVVITLAVYPSWCTAQSLPQSLTLESTLAAINNFKTCLNQMEGEALRYVSHQAFADATANLEPDLSILGLLQAQPEFDQALWDYLDATVSDSKVAAGRDLLIKNQAIFDRVEVEYQIDRYIIAAIWGVETNFSTEIGDRSVIRSTATLACIGRRQDYFRREFFAALRILQRGDIAPDRLKGSWSGAFGATQFMPTTLETYGVDLDGDGRRDIVDAPPDIIASTAKALQAYGWVKGQACSYEVFVPQPFDFSSMSHSKPISEWKQLGIIRPVGKPFLADNERAGLVLPGGVRGPAFLVLSNFDAILRYNPAEAYAFAVCHLADRLRGEGPIMQQWPRDQRMLSSAERSELQTLLSAQGFAVGPIDGMLGARTRAAIRAFQAAQKVAPDGFASAALLERLRKPQD